VPFFSLENSWAICLMLSTLRRISPAVVMMRSPAGVTRVRCLPLRAQLLKLHMYPSKQIDATGISDGI
jgi:hypothetical protein